MGQEVFVAHVEAVKIKVLHSGHAGGGSLLRLGGVLLEGLFVLGQ